MASKQMWRTETVVDPLKKAVASPYSSYLSSQIGKGVPRWEGEEFPDFEYDDKYKSSYEGFMSMDPASFFEKNITQPTMKRWGEEVAPIISEGWAGSLRGSGRYKDLEDSSMAVSERLTETAAQYIPNMYSQQLSMGGKQAAAYYAADTARFNFEYQDWLKSLPQYNPVLGQAAQFLSKNTSTGTEVMGWLEEEEQGWNWGGTAAGAVSGAVAGGLYGSVVPGIGTAIGAGAGMIIGALYGGLS